jgi:hypothetical protein
MQVKPKQIYLNKIFQGNKVIVYANIIPPKQLNSLTNDIGYTMISTWYFSYTGVPQLETPLDIQLANMHQLITYHHSSARQLDPVAS